jgi:hypothetical protein
MVRQLWTDERLCGHFVGTYSISEGQVAHGQVFRPVHWSEGNRRLSDRIRSRTGGRQIVDVSRRFSPVKNRPTQGLRVLDDVNPRTRSTLEGTPKQSSSVLNLLFFCSHLDDFFVDTVSVDQVREIFRFERILVSRLLPGRTQRDVHATVVG